MVYVAGADAVHPRIDRRVLPEGPTKLMKTLSPLRRLLVVLAVLLPAALVAPGISPAQAEIPPTPSFTASSTEPIAGQRITFTVDTPDEEKYTYIWDQDDNGEFGSPRTALTIRDPAEGLLKISLKAVDKVTGEQSAAYTQEYTVKAAPPPPPTPNKAPTAGIGVIGTTVQAGQAVTLFSQSTDPDGQPLTYVWSSNGGSAAFSDPGEAGTTVVFAQPGRWTVTLTVTDSGTASDPTPLSDSATQEIRVTEAPVPSNREPTLGFTFAPSSPVARESVSFAATASDPDGTIAKVDWDFDSDGTYEDTGTRPSHAYSAAGNYTVTARATDNQGGVTTSFQSVAVASAPSNLEPTRPIVTNGDTTIRLINPFPVVRLLGSYSGSRTKITLLAVKRAPRGAKVRVRCSGRGCPRKPVTSTAQSASRTLRLRTFERSLQAGAKLEIYVTQSRRLGRYVKFEMRRGRAPKRTDKCIRSYPRTPVTCPSEE